jgi:hypothetical protein
LSAFNPRLSLRQMHGYLFRWDQHMVMPIYHPAAILRQKARIIGLRGDLKTWAKLLNGEMTDEEARCPVCSICQSTPVRYDDRWFPHCVEHEGEP